MCVCVLLIFLHYTVMLIYCIHTRIVCVLFHFQHTTCQYSDHEVRTVVLIWWWSRGLLSVYHSPAFSSQHTTFYSDDQRRCHTQPAVCRSPASSLVCLVGAGPSHHDEKGYNWEHWNTFRICPCFLSTAESKLPPTENAKVALLAN